MRTGEGENNFPYHSYPVIHLKLVLHEELTLTNVREMKIGRQEKGIIHCCRTRLVKLSLDLCSDLCVLGDTEGRDCKTD